MVNPNTKNNLLNNQMPSQQMIKNQEEKFVNKIQNQQFPTNVSVIPQNQNVDQNIVVQEKEIFETILSDLKLAYVKGTKESNTPTS